MLRTLLWVLGLGLPAHILFGEPIGSIAGAIGFMIGSKSRPRRAPSGFKETAVATDEPPRDQPALEEHRADSGPEIHDDLAARPRTLLFRRLILGAGALAFLISVVAFLLQKPQDHDEIGVEDNNQSAAPARPIINLGETWSRDGCLHEHFGGAISRGLEVPSEIHLFCSYPWKVDRLNEVLGVINEKGISTVAILDNYKEQTENVKVSRKIAAAIETMPAMAPGALEIFQLSRVMPFIWEAKFGSAKALGEVITPEVIRDLRAAAEVVPWDEPMARSIPHEIELNTTSGQEIKLVTDTLSAPTWKEFGNYMRLSRSAQSLARRLQEIPEPFRISAELTGNWAKLGYAPVDSIMLGGLNAYINILQERSTILSNSLAENEAQWKPKWTAQGASGDVLEVFYLQDLPKPWCGGRQAIDPLGQYCEPENRLFASSQRVSRAEPDPSSIPTEIGLSAALLHELGHVFLNPAISFDAPFITEGIVTADAEEAVRAITAASSFSKEKLSSGSLVEWMKSKEWQSTASSSETESGAGQGSVQFAFSHIDSTPLTQYQTVALCLLGGALDSSFVESELSLSNSSFRAQDSGNLRRAYAAGWAIFHYGRGIIDRKDAVDQEYSTRSVLRIAEGYQQNKKASQEELAALRNLLSKVRGATEEASKRWRLKCQAALPKK